ncbi:hypothetical protein [Pseudomonas sp. W15Feb9B]|uniref:hypothetical protein n=1 Tax=Pseudomonas sp. W15Feb9B TaxID=550743 RepID=UPI000597140C|nr:hypothetical protein [Pseudomonas sp. W15Feb9B]KIK84546.1 hypothetical protein OC71_20220 [Pseudomonas sp. W15Feb9B]
MELLAQREAFCISYGVSRPQLPLRDIAHWEATLKGTAHQHNPLHDELASVAPGYFYLPVSAHPDPMQVDRLVSEAQEADWLLIPSLDSSQPLLHRPYDRPIIAVPFMPVAYLRVDNTLDNSLLMSMGRKQLKEMVRLTRRAEDFCHTELHRLDRLAENSEVLLAFSTLQSLNVDKYRHVRNLYSLAAMQALARSADSSRYYIKINYEKTTRLPVYASLSYVDEQQGVFSQQVQGQDRDRVPAGLNLYVSDYYQLYKAADELGLRTHCLGRGAIDIKKRMGANLIVDLENWLIPLRTTRAEQMREFSNRDS